MFKRHITHKLDEVLADTPVTLITGPSSQKNNAGEIIGVAI